MATSTPIFSLPTLPMSALIDSVARITDEAAALPTRVYHAATQAYHAATEAYHAATEAGENVIEQITTHPLYREQSERIAETITTLKAETDRTLDAWLQRLQFATASDIDAVMEQLDGIAAHLSELERRIQAISNTQERAPRKPATRRAR